MMALEIQKAQNGWLVLRGSSLSRDGMPREFWVAESLSSLLAIVTQLSQEKEKGKNG